jgi:bifunctional UDP-N-acetylglucosamine pyrophosphorylase/glucosamine-1-phosphate N-acetyltransferase
METTCSIILAAGKGTRLKSGRPKVLHEVLGKPLVMYALDLASGLASPVIAVVGHGRKAVMERMAGRGVEFAVQEPQLGTGHAVLVAREILERTKARHVLILPGDMPLIRKESLQGLMEAYRGARAQVGILTAVLDNPAGYGRVIREAVTPGVRIVEHSDASSEELSVREVNTSVYIMDKSFLLASIGRISPDNAKAEFYLTDVVAMARSVVAFPVGLKDEAHGINSRDQLARVQKIMQRRINEGHMNAGVTLEDPDTAWIGPDVSIGRDVRIWPGVHILGASTIGRGATIFPGSWIEDSDIGPSSVIGAGSVVRGATVARRSATRPHSVLDLK